MQESEFFGIDYEKAVNESSFESFPASWHGTNVAGVLGGNGNALPDFRYRGVAPKVHFYSKINVQNMTNKFQVGHVTNHSHITSFNGEYAPDDYALDAAIFSNWKSACTEIENRYGLACVEGDTLVKTVVYGISNNGDDGGRNKNFVRGYHSALVNSKNAVIVGNFNSETGLRYHTSGMGPTWDGRIKPDIMAPGAANEFIVDSEHPFEIQIEYVKLFREGTREPYFILDFDKHRNVLDQKNRQYDACNEIEFENKKVLDCISTIGIAEATDAKMYIGWRLNEPIQVNPSDEMEVSIRKVQGGGKNLFYGNVFFGNDKESFETSREILTPWILEANFQKARIPLLQIKYSVKTAYFLRLDFGYVRSLVSPSLCVDKTQDELYCGYTYATDGGASDAAPVVSGIATLMYQKFREKTGEPLDKRSMRNSTVKALLIHSAIDMEDSEDAHFAYNPDLVNAHHDEKPHFTPYGKGPDFATGWGRVDGQAALNLLSTYNKKTGEFSKFREIEVGNGMEKRWSMNVLVKRKHLRTTLVWDDAPGVYTKNEEKSTNDGKINKARLINDLDMYLVSPSGKYYYPWRLDTLPTSFITSDGLPTSEITGYENIHESDVHDAENGCPISDRLGEDCFDRLNNVEVVDVDAPEIGTWQVVVRGHRVAEYNNESLDAQVASLVSDVPLNEDEYCSIVHNYAPQTDYSCTYNLGNNLVNYVSFDDRTSVGVGDDVQLFDGDGVLLGTYVGRELAGKKIRVKSPKLTVVLHSDNDKSQDWGFDIKKISSMPRDILKMPFEFIKRKQP